MKYTRNLIRRPEAPSKDIAVFIAPELPAEAHYLPLAAWEELGRPDEVSVTIEGL